MSRLIETIRFANGRVENIDYHLRRMDDSSMAIFGDVLHWKPHRMLRDLELPANDIYKVRLVYDLNGGTITTDLYKIRPVRSLKLVFDNDIVYDFKFENRGGIERLMTMKEDCDDILIIKNDLVTDTSFSNIIFLKDGKWITPDSFLLNGTMRQWLLDNRRINEQRVTIGDLRSFTRFKLINAMLRDDSRESEVSNIR